MTAAILFASVTAALAFLVFATLERLISTPEKRFELGPALEKLRQVHDNLPRLLALKDKGKEEELDGLARSMARAIQANCRFLAYLIRCSALEQPSHGKEAKDIEQLVNQNGGLHWRATKILFWIRFRPARVRDCRSIGDAMAEEGRVWIAYLNFLERQYMDGRGGAVVPGYEDDQEIVTETTAAARSEPRRGEETTRKPYH